MRNVKGCGKDILTNASVSEQGEVFFKYLFHEQIDNVLPDDLLCFSPETKEIVGSEAFKHIGYGFSFVRVRGECSGKHLVQVGE